MVDFKKLRQQKLLPTAINPRDVFQALPKPPEINDLYASQAEVLDAWYVRRAEEDLVIKLHTGGGKTLVALLIAQSVMNELEEPVLYLAPTRQLVEQVVAKSKEYGIPAVPYTKGVPLPSEFLDGRCVLVGTYEALFNGKSKFGILGKGTVGIGAIILDDAHTALTSVRDSFSLEISAEKHKEVYRELTSIFRPSFVEVRRNGLYDDIVKGKDSSVIEVPVDFWEKKHSEIGEYLKDKVDAIDVFAWPLLRDTLGQCHCLVSRDHVTITPILPSIQLIPSFSNCKRRIYMSATIADDSEIIRTFDANLDAVSKPISSQSLAGVGERMILVPELTKIDSPILPLVQTLATDFSNNKTGTIALVPSSSAAKAWAPIAHFPGTSEEVAHAVREMQSGKYFGPMVLANRYDGIDLPNNACRLLILDGLPRGIGNYELFKENVLGIAGINALLAQRIEQGIGRGTRGSGDYCVIILMGRDLVAWIGRKSSLGFLTASTRVQLNLGQEISNAVLTQEEFEDTVNKSINRDQDWVSYHASELAAGVRTPPAALDDLKLASIERRIFRLQAMGQYGDALLAIEKALDLPEISEDDDKQAWLLSLASRIAYQANDPISGDKFQTRAFGLNPKLNPPKAKPVYKSRPIPGRQAEKIIQLFGKYRQKRGLLAKFEEDVAELTREASSNRFENALAALGEYIGFQSERPDNVYGVGPDVLWITDADFDFIVEAKNEKDPQNPLYKNDHAQLMEAEQWFKTQYPSRKSLRLLALPTSVADSKASTDGTYALEMDNLIKLVGSVRSLISELIISTKQGAEFLEYCEECLVKNNLKADAIIVNFLKPFTKSS